MPLNTEPSDQIPPLSIRLMGIGIDLLSVGCFAVAEGESPLGAFDTIDLYELNYNLI